MDSNQHRFCERQAARFFKLAEKITHAELRESLTAMAGDWKARAAGASMQTIYRVPARSGSVR